MIGKEFNGFHILAKLGEGGMAEVYKALDLKLEREVAIKFLRASLGEDEEIGRQRFEFEAKALAKLNHPNIVSVLGYGEYEGRPYLVMDYVPGGTLKDKLGKPMQWEKAAALLVPIANALHYAHGRKIIHRDVKPSNILLNEHGQPMLSDFGVAKMLESEKTMELTGTNVGIGTPHYMSPEQGRSQKVGPKSDIYSLGVVLYEMVTGRKPFEADTPFAVLLKHIEDPIPLPTKRVRTLPENAERVILRALAKDPKSRYADMNELALVLGGGAEKLAPTGKPLPKYALPLGAVAVLALVVLFALQGRAQEDSPSAADTEQDTTPVPASATLAVSAATLPPDNLQQDSLSSGGSGPVLFSDTFDGARIDNADWVGYSPIDSSYINFTQAAGNLEVSVQQFSGDEDAGYISRKSWSLSEISSVETRILFEEAVNAQWLAASFGLYTATGAQITCDAKVHSGDNFLECFAWSWNESFPRHVILRNVPIRPGEWIDVRIEISPDQSAVSIYVNGVRRSSSTLPASSTAQLQAPLAAYINIGTTRLQDNATIKFDYLTVRGVEEQQPSSDADSLFDDFSVGSAGQPFDAARWRLANDPIGCGVSWDAGELALVPQEQLAEAGCYFEPAAFGRSVGASTELFGAKILVADDYQGSNCCPYFSLDLYLGQSNSPESGGWVACAVHVGSDFVVGVFAVSTSRQEIFRRDKRLTFGTVYDVRLENDNGLVSCYFDGVLLGQADIVAPIVGGAISVGWASNASVTFQLDDVRLYP
ncbi:MAG: serine/threonine protein kinase [Anaerolineales bacterium]|nr:serine/threonine protein kinase [Anaerolineales bacterium]